ncbi:uncharacterized protein TNCV_371631 [Trichonephila clavipes]|nr:uncharacterized protein TNCV_371631 [Trichonephila clavipes]
MNPKLFYRSRNAASRKDYDVLLKHLSTRRDFYAEVLFLLTTPTSLGGPQNFEGIRSSPYPGKVCLLLLFRIADDSTRGLLATDHVILNHGQVTWTTPELAPPLLTTTPHQREDVSALDRFNVHRCPTRRVFSGTGLEPVTKQATVRYLYHSATAATNARWDFCEKEK